MIFLHRGILGTNCARMSMKLLQATSSIRQNPVASGFILCAMRFWPLTQSYSRLFPKSRCTGGWTPLSDQTLAPFLGMLRVVEYAVHGYGVAHEFIEHRVGEAPNQCSPIFLIDDGVHFWIAADSLDACVDASQKLLPQTFTTFLIPVIGFAEILLDFGSNDQLNGHGDHESCAGRFPRRGLSGGC